VLPTVGFPFDGLFHASNGFSKDGSLGRHIDCEKEGKDANDAADIFVIRCAFCKSLAGFVSR
jgi:hypothetical protein